MTLDEFKSEWAKRDEALTNSLRAGAAFARAAFTDAQRQRIRRRHEMGPFGMIVWIATLVLVGGFIADHWGEWRFVAPAALIQAWTIIVGAVSLRERAALDAIDYAAAPLAIQSRLAALREGRARTVQWAFLTGQLVWWIPFVIVLARGAFGVDLYAISEFMPRFLAINVIGGLVLIPVALIAARALAPSLRGSSSWRAFVDAIAGRDLAEARALADRLARFEQDAAA